MAEAKVALIGGSGLHDMEGLVEKEEVDLQTPFGAPSDTIAIGTLNATQGRFPPTPWPRTPPFAL